jgi:hypothetical protein
LPELARRWTYFAWEDQRVADVLQIYGNLPLTWSTLYLIFELIEEDYGGKIRGLCAPHVIEDFCFSANENRAFLEGSRHAKKKGGRDPSKRRKISLPVAQLVIRDLMNAWLGDKIGYEMKYH